MKAKRHHRYRESCSICQARRAATLREALARVLGYDPFAPHTPAKRKAGRK